MTSLHDVSMRVASLRRAGAAALVLLAIAGCSPDTDVLARVGSQTITTGDFEMMARALASRYPGLPDSAKAHLLRDIVDRELLVQGALREGLHRDTTFLDTRRKVEEQLLRQSFYDQLGATAVVVSQAEMEELHRWRAEERDVQIVFAMSKPAIDAALGQIRAGADFGDVADRFNPAGYTPPKGDLGYVQAGMLQQPLDDVIRLAPVGKVQGPIEAIGQGWFLVRVKDVRKSEPRPLRQEGPLLETILRQRKQRAILVKALERLRGDYQMRLAPGAAQSLIAYVVPPSLQSQATPPLTMQQSALTLASYDGGVYTMGDAVDDLRSGGAQKPNFNLMPSVERWIEMRALERAALIEARRRQLGEEPELQRAVRERMNDYLLQGYVTTHVLERTSVTDSEARAIFERSGMKPERLHDARFLVVALRDSATAAQLAATAPQTEGLREAVSTAALGVPVKTQTATYPTENPMWQALEGPLTAAAPRGYTPAVPIGGFWLVAQLVSKNMAPQTFETLPQEMRTAFVNEVREEKRSLLLATLSDSLRRMIPVEIHWQRLKHVAWPTPGLPTMEG